MQGKSPGQVRRGGRSRMGEKGSGPSGYCVCPSCGTKVPHKAGLPCNQIDCPKCNMKMMR